MVFTLIELFNLIVVTAVLGFIFMDFIPISLKIPDYVFKRSFNWDKYKLAILVAAPGVVIHELSHKFVALTFGLSAEFKLFAIGLILALILKLVHSPFLIIAPGYVGILGNATPIQTTLIAFAGPFINLLLWIGSWLLLKKKGLNHKTITILGLTSRINMILFIFNMIPFGPLDGAKVLSGLLNIF